MEEPKKACIEMFLCPGVRDIMPSLCDLQSAHVVHFSTIFRTYKLMRLQARQTTENF